MRFTRHSSSLILSSSIQCNEAVVDTESGNEGRGWFRVDKGCKAGFNFLSLPLQTHTHSSHSDGGMCVEEERVKSKIFFISPTSTTTTTTKNSSPVRSGMQSNLMMCVYCCCIPPSHMWCVLAHAACTKWVRIGKGIGSAVHQQQQPRRQQCSTWTRTDLMIQYNVSAVWGRNPFKSYERKGGEDLSSFLKKK